MTRPNSRVEYELTDKAYAALAQLDSDRREQLVQWHADDHADVAGDAEVAL